MRKGTGITDLSDFCSGWLPDYAEAVRAGRYPVGFALSAGFFCLTSVMGRTKARYHTPFMDLYCPLWLFPIGNSGIGKSLSGTHAMEYILKPWGERHPEFFPKKILTFTIAGFMREAIDHQKKSKHPFEGAIFIDEASALLQKRTGTENMKNFFIVASDFNDVEYWVQHAPDRVIEDFSAGFTLATTPMTLRASVDVQGFADGFMHRFLPICEVSKREDEEDLALEEMKMDPDAMERLLLRLEQIYRKAPEFMDITTEARYFLRQTRRSQERLAKTSVLLSGLYNRMVERVHGIAVAFALSEGAFTVTLEHVTNSLRLLEHYLLPPLLDLGNELSGGFAKANMYNATDDLSGHGADGMPMEEFKKKLKGHKTQRNELFKTACEEGLVHQGVFNGKPWVWPTAHLQFEGKLGN